MLTNVREQYDYFPYVEKDPVTVANTSGEVYRNNRLAYSQKKSRAGSFSEYRWRRVRKSSAV